MKDADWERLLGQALAPAAEPEEDLDQALIHQLKERNLVKSKHRRRLSIGLLAALLLLLVSVSAYAATQLFSAKQVAESFGDRLLAEAFDSKDAMEINRSIASGDYSFTLHGLVSGAGLSQFKHSSEEIYPDRTYAVVSIVRQDGKPMPAVNEPEYGEVPFFISPLIKGLKPWQVNIVTMNGGYSEDVIDGVMYRLISCDQVEIFADRGVYLAVSSGSPFYRNEAFAYDESTGEIRSKEGYSGASALFDLPLNIAKADPVKAEAYLESMLKPTSSPESPSDKKMVADARRWAAEIKTKIKKGEEIGETLPDSIKEVTYDDAGNLQYSHDGRSVTMAPDSFFQEGQSGFSETFSVSKDGDTFKALLFHKDENGVITGRIIVLN